MQTTKHYWSPETICLRPRTIDVSAIAADVYARTCRSDFEAPGFCVVSVGASIESPAFRQLMIAIQREMASIHMSQTEESLVYLSAARFDQQESTRPHLDGGPDECFLMLGYEPTQISSEVEIYDYAKCAYDLGLSPKEFMALHNPMFKSGLELIQPYGTKIPCFAPDSYQIVCINNSSAPYSPDGSTWQGTLHTATILTPDESKRRVINSTMIARVPGGTAEPMDEVALNHFVHTSEAKRRGYDKLHLTDDK